jgi:hypothetical protein
MPIAGASLPTAPHGIRVSQVPTRILFPYLTLWHTVKITTAIPQVGQVAASLRSSQC